VAPIPLIPSFDSWVFFSKSLRLKGLRIIYFNPNLAQRLRLCLGFSETTDLVTIGGPNRHDNSQETVEGRRRPGSHGIRVANGIDRIGSDRFYADARDDYQQCVLKRGSEPDYGQLAFGFRQRTPTVVPSGGSAERRLGVPTRTGCKSSCVPPQGAELCLRGAVDEHQVE